MHGHDGGPWAAGLAPSLSSNSSGGHGGGDAEGVAGEGGGHGGGDAEGAAGAAPSLSLSTKPASTTEIQSVLKKQKKKMGYAIYPQACQN